MKIEKMKKILDVKNLKVSFHTYLGKVYAVRGISFSISKGEAVAIVGESGCGKSVTAQAILGLIPSPPGKVVFDKISFNDIDLTKTPYKKLKSIRGKGIGMIFQDPMTSLNPILKIGKQIMESFVAHYKMSWKESRLKAMEMLDLVQISSPEKILEQYPHQLSGGMRQRVMIAIALACRPELLIADEPTTALDVTIQDQILNLMKDLKRKINTSIILITHDLGIVAGMCERIIVLYAGKIVEINPVDDIFYRPRHPYTQSLLKALPRLEMDRNKPLEVIEGQPPNLSNSSLACAFYPRCKYAMQVCKKYEPPLKKTENNGYVACWLNHPYANGIKKRFQEENDISRCKENLL